LAEDLRGEGRVVAEPSLCECVVKRLERGQAKCKGTELNFRPLQKMHVSM
jgi:hypothetical protein